jgi:tetratricopeptide (TPR) repeat protein
VPGPIKPDFFISYTSADRPWAEWIAWQLEAIGYTTRLQTWDFASGPEFVREMEQAVASAERTIAVLSPDYLSSSFGEREWRVAFAKDPSGERRLLVPVRVRECQPPGLLAPGVCIDLLATHEETAKARLLAGLHEKGARPSQSPRFPGSGPGSIAELSRFPGDLPPIWSVPYSHHPSFTGRDELLAALHHSFARPRGAIYSQVLAGLGGVGKTQLAAEYAYRHRAEYGLVWWVRAEHRTTLVGDYAALGTKAGLPPHPDQDAALAAVRNWLEHERRRRWLLILDAVEGPQTLRELVPQSGDGHVLATSRDGADWHGTADLVSVDVLRLADATDLLLVRTGESDRAAAEELANVLGCLPLALEQAGALIAQTGVITVATYLDLFRRRSPDMLTRGQPRDGRHPVATTWNLSLRELQRESPAAVELLNLAAFLAPEELPWQPLVDHVEVLPPVLASAAGDLLEFASVVAALRRYSLAKVAGEGLVIHRLLQTVIYERLDQQSRRDWATVAVRVLERSFPSEPSEPSSWPECQRLLPHALHAVRNAGRLSVEPYCSAQLIDHAVEYLMARGQLHQAKELTEWLLPMAEESQVPSSATAAIHRSLGRVLRDLGKPADALAQLGQALVIDQTVFGQEDARVAQDHYLLGRVLRELGRLPDARAQLELALAIDQGVYGPQHRWVAEDRRSLGRVLQNLGDLAGARAQMERALQIDEALFGPDHWSCAYDRCQLATVLRDLGELTEAHAQLERALEIDERTFGPEHWRAGQDRRYLATVLRDLGELEAAAAQLERAVEIDETVYDPEDWRVAQDRRYLGTVLHALGEIAEARTQLEWALTIDEATYGRDHWRAGQNHGELGLVLRDLGDLPAARRELERALEITEATYGDDDWRVAKYSRYYSRVLRDLGKPDEELSRLERALSIDARTFGSEDRRVAQDRLYLSRALLERGGVDRERAAEQVALVSAILERRDLHHPAWTAIRRDLEALQRELGS